MSDTSYEIFQDRRSYRVRITRLASFVQEAAGFATRADAVARIAQAQRMAAANEEKDPVAAPHLRAV